MAKGRCQYLRAGWPADHRPVLPVSGARAALLRRAAAVRVSASAMPPKFHSARAYVAFDESVRNVETWVYARTPRFCGFDARDVAKRLIQRVVEIGLNELVLACAGRLDAGQEPLPGPRSAYSCGGLVIDSAGGRIRVRAALFLRSVGLVLAHVAPARLVRGSSLFP